MSSLELKIPPDAVWVAVAGLMWLVSRVTVGFGAAESLRCPLASILIAIGMGFIVAARVALNRAGTTWHPTEPGLNHPSRHFRGLPFQSQPDLPRNGDRAPGLGGSAGEPGCRPGVGDLHRLHRPFPDTAGGTHTLGLFGQDYLDYSKRVRRWVRDLTSASSNGPDLKPPLRHTKGCSSTLRPTLRSMVGKPIATRRDRSCVPPIHRSTITSLNFLHLTGYNGLHEGRERTHAGHPHRVVSHLPARACGAILFPGLCYHTAVRRLEFTSR